MYFYFFTKKADFRAIFRHGQRSVAEPGPTPSPWSITVKQPTKNMPITSKSSILVGFCSWPLLLPLFSLSLCLLFLTHFGETPNILA